MNKINENSILFKQKFFFYIENKWHLKDQIKLIDISSPNAEPTES